MRELNQIHCYFCGKDAKVNHAHTCPFYDRVRGPGRDLYEELKDSQIGQQYQIQWIPLKEGSDS